MSEKIASSPEQKESLELHEHAKRQQEILNEAKHEAEKTENQHAKKIEEIRDLINEQAVVTDNKNKSEQQAQTEPEVANTYWNSSEYRDLAFRQLMGRVRKHMSGSERAASKVIHQPTVERLSEIGEKTVARTSGVLVGSIFSFVVSLSTYYLSRRNGYDMTYAIFIVSFFGGFIFGLLIEFGYKSIRALLSRS